MRGKLINLEVMFAATVDETDRKEVVVQAARSVPREQVISVLGEQMEEVAGMNVSMMAKSARTMKSERVHGKVFRNKTVSLIHRILDELGIFVAICGRNMAAEENNSGRTDK